MATQPSHPPVFPENTHTTLHRLLASALLEARTTPTAVANTFMSQWIRILENAMPHRALWHQTRDLLWVVIDHLAAAGRNGDMVAWLEQGITQSHSHADPETVAKLQIQLGRERIHQGEPALAKILLEEGGSYFEAANLPYAPAFNALANLAVSQAQWDTAEQLVNRALTSMQEDDWKEQGVSCRLLGNVASGRAQHQEALQYQQEGLRWWRRGNQPRYIAFGLVNVGSAFRPLARFSEAKAHYLEAIPIFEQVGDPLNRAYAQLNLGNIYMLGEEWEEAINQYHQAEQVLSHSQHHFPLAVLYNNWGMAYAGLKEWKSAIRAYQYSIAIWTEIENFQQRANDRDNLGVAYIGLGKYDDAIRTFHQALDDLKQGNVPTTYPLYSEVYQHLAEAEQRREGR